MNRNMVGSILGRFSIKFAHLVPIRLQTWPPQTILERRRFLKIGQSETKIAYGGHVC
jgi:hypothetical protein